MVVQVLGHTCDPGMEIELSINNFNLRVNWPDELVEEVKAIDPSIVLSDDRSIAEMFILSRLMARMHVTSMMLFIVSQNKKAGD